MKARHMLGAAIALSAFALPSALAAAKPAATLFVVEKKDGTIAAVDPASLKILWRAPVGEDAHEVILTPDGKRAIVSNYGGPAGVLHTLSVVDLATHAALPAIDIAPLRDAHGMVIDGDQLYFTAETNKLVARLDLASGKVDWMMGTGQDRNHMLVHGPGHSLASANANSGTVSFFVPVEIKFAGAPRADWSVITVPVGDGAQGLDITPDGKTLWVNAAKLGVVSIVDIATHKVTDTIALPVKAGNRLKITPDGKTALIGASQLFGIDIASHMIRTLDIGGVGEGILITPDGKTAYVALPQENKVAIVDIAAWNLTGTIATGASPDGMAWLAN